MQVGSVSAGDINHCPNKVNTRGQIHKVTTYTVTAHACAYLYYAYITARQQLKFRMGSAVFNIQTIQRLEYACHHAVVILRRNIRRLTVTCFYKVGGAGGIFFCKSEKMVLTLIGNALTAILVPFNKLLNNGAFFKAVNGGGFNCRRKLAIGVDLGYSSAAATLITVLPIFSDFAEICAKGREILNTQERGSVMTAIIIKLEAVVATSGVFR